MTAEPATPEAPTLSPEVTARWQARFRAPRVSLPGWADDAPQRSLYTSDVSGVVEQYAWDRDTDEHRKVTDRPNGTLIGTLSPDGETIWWFADTDGDEFGVWRTQPFGGGEDTVAVPEVEPAYPAGLEVGRSAGGGGPVDGRRQRAVAGARRVRAAGDLPAHRPGVGRRTHPRRRAAGDLALGARRPALPGAARAPHRGHHRGGARRRRREVGRRGPGPARAGVRPPPRRPAAARRARAPGPGGTAGLGRRRGHRDRDRARPPRRRHGRLVPRRLGAARRPRPRRAQRALPLRPGRRCPREAGHPDRRRPRGHRPTRGHRRARLVLLGATPGDPAGRRSRRAHGGQRGAPCGVSGRGPLGARPGRGRARPAGAPGRVRGRTPRRSWCTAARSRWTTTPTAPAGRPTSTPATRSCT